MDEQPLGTWESSLLEDLCVDLRRVGVHEAGIPSDSRTVAFVEAVQSKFAELTTRGVELGPRIAALSAECGWDMEELLTQCVAYPKLIPMVREADGVRRALRCPGCRSRERPQSDDHFFLCSECLHACLHAVRVRVPLPGMLLFRTYSQQWRCPHAGDETVLVKYPDEYELYGTGSCETYIVEELNRRKRAG